MRFTTLVLTYSVLISSFFDHLTTWWCLREPVPGWVVTEVNPMADWLFVTVGLVPGLLIDSVFTVIVVVWFYRWNIPEPLKIGFLSVVTVVTTYAVVNNYNAIVKMGLM